MYINNYNIFYSFTNVPFTLTLYQLKIKEGSEQYMDEVNEENEQMLFPQYIEDMMNTNNDFPPRAHCLARSGTKLVSAIFCFRCADKHLFEVLLFL